MSRDVECPHCGALAGAMCRTSSGDYMYREHRQRFLAGLRSAPQRAVTDGDVRRVISLRDALWRGDCTHGRSIAKTANIIPGWFIQRRRDRHAVYDIWPASCRNPDVQHALPPCPHPSVPAMKARALLAKLWIPDAMRWLESQDQDLVLDMEHRIDTDRAKWARKKEGK